jgi:hypothetical protein
MLTEWIGRIYVGMRMMSNRLVMLSQREAAAAELSIEYRA